MAPLAVFDGVDTGARNDRGRDLTLISIVFTVGSGVVVFARFYTRWVRKVYIGWDDWTILVAWLLVVPETTFYCLGNMIFPLSTLLTSPETTWGFGLHQGQVNFEHLENAYKDFFGAQLCYRSILTLAQISMLFLYLRIFTDKTFRLTVRVLIVALSVYGLSSIVTTVWQCSPTSKFWDTSEDGRCIDVRLNWYTTAAFSIAFNVALIVLPILELRHLSLPPVQKVELAVLFALGVFVIVTTIVRLTSAGPSQGEDDVPYMQALSHIWTSIETNAAIICASLPTLRAPLHRLFPCLHRPASVPSPASGRRKPGTSSSAATTLVGGGGRPDLFAVSRSRPSAARAVESGDEYGGAYGGGGGGGGGYGGGYGCRGFAGSGGSSGQRRMSIGDRVALRTVCQAGVAMGKEGDDAELDKETMACAIRMTETIEVTWTDAVSGSSGEETLEVKEAR